ncbi:unnamed protein product, partial [Ectocarpus sp. 12 AP-2014]
MWEQDRPPSPHTFPEHRFHLHTLHQQPGESPQHWVLAAEEARKQEKANQSKQPLLVIMRASHILVKHQGSRRTASWKDVDGVAIKTRTKAEAINMLMDLRAKISTQEDFAEIAQEHSDCGSARAGGDLGEFGDGQMMQPFEDATRALRVGEISS